MKTTIEQLWSGELDPSVERGRKSEEINDLTKIIQRHGDFFEEKLGEKGKETVEKLMDAYWEMVSLLNEESFVRGFSLGVKLVSEAYFSER